MIERPLVGFVACPGIAYPGLAPFDPSDSFAELARLPGGHLHISPEANQVYPLVRSALAECGLDRERFGTPDWNPLRGLVPEHGLVVLKPNLVLEAREGDSVENALTTHGSVVRVLVDYVRLAGGSQVEILIGDVPLQGADFEQVVRQNGLRSMVEALRARGDCRIALFDLRRERAIVDDTGFIRSIEPQTGDPRGYQEVDLGSLSRLEGLTAAMFEGFAVTDYRHSNTQAAHASGRHVYLVPQSVLDADLFINIPKLKTHQKAGITVAMKNLVGVNGDKARIPHFRLGGGNGQDSGDEYPPDRAWLRSMVSRTQQVLQGRSRLLYNTARNIWRRTRHMLISQTTPERVAGSATLVAGGAWYGNDTLWRALHDLNHIIVFAGRNGQLHSEPQRKYLCVVDGVIAGEGDGPLRPVARQDGVIMAGKDALAIDLVSARYMGFDWQRIPVLRDALAHRPAWTRVEAPLDEGGVNISVSGSLESAVADRPFVPPPGWLGRVESCSGQTAPHTADRRS